MQIWGLPGYTYVIRRGKSMENLCPSCKHPAFNHATEQTNRYRRKCTTPSCGCGITEEEILDYYKDKSKEVK